MRVHLGGDPSSENFSKLLLRIGEGNYQQTDGKMAIPSGLGNVTKLDELLSAIYPGISNIRNKAIEWLCERAILTPKNESAAAINEKLLGLFNSEDFWYKSIDTTTNIDESVQYPQEFLNSMNPSGLPPHRLHLKVGAPIMLLRNLCPPKLCNGTRLQITRLQKNIIEATVLTGCARAESVLVPRIPLIPSDWPFQFKRLQFPVKVCFSMTINKSQGQTLKFAGID